MALIDYQSLFEKEKGASDYIAITKWFSIIFIENWIKTNLSEKNKMRWIILFIDEIYNHKCKIFILGESKMEDLFIWDDIGDSEETFMLERCLSRLMEIMSD